jgi:hypothetical protein
MLENDAGSMAFLPVVVSWKSQKIFQNRNLGKSVPIQLEEVEDMGSLQSAYKSNI